MATVAQQQPQEINILQLVLDLTNHEKRERALVELSKNRESYAELAPILWHSTGTVSAILQEIVSIYPRLTPPTLSNEASNRVCNALALLQTVASHKDTRKLFLNAHIPLYLYPFLNTSYDSKPFEYLRLTSLGVIGALVKVDDSAVINFLLQTEIIPLCLQIMESGTELSKTVSTFIVQKILLDDMGLNYICQTVARFYAVSSVLNRMVEIEAKAARMVEIEAKAGRHPNKRPSLRLIKHIIRCYLRISENARACDALRQYLPTSLRDNTFAQTLATSTDPATQTWLSTLLHNIRSGPQQDAKNVHQPGPNGGGPGDVPH
mmetsp:Transcript_31810/g.46877  ORF Transcript_31810/g.46877 Transcript_31810/m.46877 type:complete len:321 (+) Transcript_31810:347-1309(+)|eukprot:CAMPEP_0195526486 /NCGR_PEP_ID=MMETSP0794_2-20130614/27586_1 /TAXON_ID=515487 /ORGANISM="Stephanopyxis turris, Strain CCMP 815" /LENGTH=320 /DNA_ID=CAMNT_0040657181 /DNA_START=344 /DNA_END=1306 /DNA_ORIENTATION=+